MKYYNSYIERQEISREMHQKLLELGREGAARPRTARPARRWQSIAVLAACCVLIVGVGVWKLTMAQGGEQIAGDALYPGVKDTYGPGEFSPDSVQGDIQADGVQGAADFHGFVVKGGGGDGLALPAIPAILYQNVDYAMDSAASIALPEGSFLQDLSKEDIQRIFWGPEGKPAAEGQENETGDLPWMLFWGGYTVHGYAIYDGEGNLFVLYIFGELAGEHASFELSAAPGRLPPQCLAEPGLETTEVFGVEVTGWSQVYDRDGDGVTDFICGSEFMSGDIGVRFENVNSRFGSEQDGQTEIGTGEAQFFNALFVRQALSDDGGLHLGHLLTAEAVPDWRTEEFSTLAQARAEAEFAPYLPQSAPSGYGDFNGYLSYQEGRENLLWVRWSRGYDDVQVKVSLPEGEADVPTVDIAVPASYDRRLYEIPLAETVPEEYRDSVWMPAFRAEDMSLEIVKARASGKDTGGESYRFRVLHSNGVLVEYQCGGLTAEAVWSMVEDTLN